MNNTPTRPPGSTAQIPPFWSALYLLFPAAVSSLAGAEDNVLVTLKLVKKAGVPVELPVKLEFPKSCKACEIVEDPAYARQNEREVILAMRIPRSTPLDLNVKTDSNAFRRVTLETVDLQFQPSADGLSFTLPSQIADRVNSGEFQTHLYWPGIELRLEHADPARPAGDYASGEFPLVERKATNNLEFGVRLIGSDSQAGTRSLR